MDAVSGLNTGSVRLLLTSGCSPGKRIVVAWRDLLHTSYCAGWHSPHFSDPTNLLGNCKDEPAGILYIIEL